MDRETALRNIIAAWNNLPSWSSTSEIQSWMSGPMWHAVNDAREALGIPRTDAGGPGSRS